MFCNKCGIQVGDGAKFCPQCGAAFQSAGKVPEKTGKGNKKVGGLIVGFAIFGIAVLIVGMIGITGLFKISSFEGGKEVEIGGVKYRYFDRNDSERVNMDFTGVGVVGCKENEKAVVIPPQIKVAWKMYPVKVVVTGAFVKNQVIEEVEINVPEVGSQAFYGCVNLTSLELSNNVQKIGHGAFWHCTSLTSVEIPASVREVDMYAFKDCTSLTNVKIEGNVMGYEMFAGCTSLINVDFPDSITEISTAAFSGCTSLNNVEIPDSVTWIGYNAFQDCTSLTNIEIPPNVTEITSRLFWGCTNLASVALPNGLKKIDVEAFRECTSLTRIDLPNSVTEINGGAFYNCTSLELKVPENAIGSGIEHFTNCKSVEYINSNTTEINTTETNTDRYTRSDFKSDKAYREYLDFGDLSGLK